ncbi:MAG: cytidine deaminase [Candidatus Aminicenantes bacterium]|nr:cytidine deaminase [Candidatus Aminicenantes bacterium]
MIHKEFNITEDQWNLLAHAAWECRNHAYVLGNIKVGAAVMASDGSIFIGCNVEHRFRCHDVHAEVNAITSMIAAGHTELIALMIAAEQERFTPCGGCMDWIFQFGGPSCLVAYQSKQGSEIKIFQAQDLMPYYPK